MTAGLILDTPTGTLRILEQAGAIISVRWLGDPQIEAEPVADETGSPLLAEAARQIEQYFTRQSDRFDLPLHLDGSRLDLAVWAAMQAIPFGHTRTYGEIAREVGAPARAVGTACGRNPIPVIVPCHRVLGAGGALTGFSGGRGVETKRLLLVHEGVLLA